MTTITRKVWLLSAISFLTDAASEMLYPVMPVYLKAIGFSMIWIGLVEGIAEATAGLSKGYFGKLSDQSGRRVPFVRSGYALSAFSKPLIALSTFPLWIIFARTLDRFGKGIRTGARDALLSEEATRETKGRVFGFHRAMDTAGAVVGPLFALLYLYYFPEQYRPLFFIAFFPGLLAIVISFFLRERQQVPRSSDTSHSFFSFLKYWKQSPSMYRKVVAGLLVFSLFNSSDFFLLLKAKEAGMNDTLMIGVYLFYNLVYSVFAFPMGILADRLGLKRIFILGLLFFSFTYAGLAIISSKNILWLLFFSYGLFSASTEGVSKAWISNITPPSEVATAIGTFTAFQSICTLLASTLTGFLWAFFGSTIALLLIAIAAIGTIIYYLVLPES